MQWPPPPGFMGRPPFMPPPGFPMPYPPPGLRPPFFPGPMPLPLPRPATLAQPLAKPPTLAKPTTGGPPAVLPAGTPAAAPSADAAAPMPGKATTLYVGKIAASVEEDAMRALLEACGAVKSWKRMTDPSTGQPKGFGFCEYEEIEGVLCALRLLNNLKLDGQELLLKTNTATQRYMEAVEKQRAAQAAAVAAAKAKEADNAPPGTDAAGADTSAAGDAPIGAAAGPGSEDGEHGPDPEKTEEERDNEVLERVMALVSDRAAAAGGGGQRVGGSGVSVDADSFLSSLHDDRRGGASGSRGGREDRYPAHDEERSERAMEAEFAREREMERKESEARAREAERLLKERTRDWERHEREAREAADREAEREREAARERARLLRADLDDPDSDEDDERWRRKPLATSRRALARKWHRQREEEEDAADRAEEAAERRELPGPPAGGMADGVSREGDGAAAAAEVEAAAVAAAELAARQAQVDRDDPIYQAMMAAAKAPPRAAPPPPALGAAGQAAEEQAAAAVSAAPRAAAAAPPPAVAKPVQPRKRSMLAAFGGEDEDDKPKRVLRPIQYTEEELRAMKAREAERVKPEDAEAALKELIRAIPTDRERVFAYPIKWDAFDAAAATLVPKLSGWVSKKITELLGVDEPTMVSFVIGQLKQHMEPEKLLAELQAVLDEEAPGFVLKLFRSVILSTEKQALGLLEA